MASTSARIEVYPDPVNRGKYRWRLRARNNKIQCEGDDSYDSKRNARRGAASAVKAMRDPELRYLDEEVAGLTKPFSLRISKTLLGS